MAMSTEIVSRADINLPVGTLTRTGIVVNDGATIEDYQAAIEFVTRAEGACMFWIGDLLNSAEGKFKEAYSQLMGDDQSRYKTYAQAKWVCGSVGFSVRTESLTFDHHVRVASLPPKEQKKWLARAEKEDWSVSKLRAEIRVWQKSQEDAASGVYCQPEAWQMSWDDWLNTVGDCDLLATDPPYSTDVEDIKAFSSEWLPKALARVKPTGRAYVCVGAYPKELHAYIGCDHADMALDDILVWTYRNCIGPSTKIGYSLNWQAILYFVGKQAPPLNCEELSEKFAVFDISAPDGRHGTKLHTWQKPEELCDRIIRHATQPGDTILDPFCGSGSFLSAAARLGRKAIGCDIDEAALSLCESRGVKVHYAR